MLLVSEDLPHLHLRLTLNLEAAASTTGSLYGVRVLVGRGGFFARWLM